MQPDDRKPQNIEAVQDRLAEQERRTPSALADVSSLSLATLGLFIFHGLQRP
jgi:hypothetical protein